MFGEKYDQCAQTFVTYFKQSEAGETDKNQSGRYFVTKSLKYIYMRYHKASE